MKPNFALKLSNDGIELLHRASGGWLSVGTLDFAADDVAQGCARLVAEAQRLEPEGIRTKLVLPDSETRYTSVVAPGPTDEARRYQIEAEIEALTPYSVDELAYDWSVEGDYALVAVVAKETLSEAEGFAEGYGFNPVSFVAAPESGEFNGEPFFGQTSVAPAHLPSGETIQRDVETVRVIGAVSKSAPAAKAQAPVEAKPSAAPPAVTDSEKPEPGADKAATGPRAPAAPRDPVKPAAAAPKTPAAPAASPNPAERAGRAAPRHDTAAQPTTGARRAVPAMPSLSTEPLAKVGGLVRRMGTRLRREQAQETRPDGAASGLSTPAPKPSLGGGNSTPATPASAAKPASPAIGGLARKDSDRAGSRPTPVAPVTPAKTPVDTTPVAQSGAKTDDAPVAFSSRRPQAPVVASSNPDTVIKPQSPGGRIAMVPGAGAPSNGGAQSFAQGLLQRGRGLMSSTIAATRLGAERDDRQGRRRAAAPEPIVAASRPPASEREKASEAEALTIFGARGNQAARSSLGGTALLATGGVLLLVVAVAVWALYFRGPGGETTQLAGLGANAGGQVETPAGDPIEAPAAVGAPEDGGTQAAGLSSPGPEGDAPAQTAAPELEPSVGDGAADPAQVAGAETPETAPAPEPSPAADEQLAANAAGDATQPETPQADDPNRLLEALVQEALTEALPDVAPQAGAAAPAVEQATAAGQPGAADTPASGQQAGTQLATRAGGGTATDTPQVAAGGTALRRLSLPSGFDVPPTQETGFSSPPPPPPPGTNFTFDERGLVEATPEGAVTPTGVTVYARRPDLVPAPRPLNAIPRDALPPDFPRADPALADARPRPRSDAIAEAVRAFQEQGGQPVADPAPDPGDGQQDAALQPDPAVPNPAEPLQTPQPEIQTAALDAADAPPPGGVSLAALSPQAGDPRPQQRPTDLVAPPVAPAEPTAEPAPQVEPGLVESAGAPEIDLDGATEEAVAASLQPRDRPTDVAERAQAALAALAEQEQQQEERRTETRAAQPDIPTSASVARQATETNAIRLNRINLIGVFGTADDRRALVRLSSGRVVRVQVGDQLDGGRVTAIGQNELRYTKNGRNEVLEIDS